MSGGIYVLKGDDKLVKLSEQPYEKEDRLQALLEDYPSLLAGDQIRPSSPRRWLLVKREAPVPGEEGGGGRWSLDHLFLDQDGIPTLVEVKRSSDTRIRREVVGQMLDYAANAVAYWPVESLRAHFEQTCAERQVAPDETMSEFLGAPDKDAEAFWGLVKTNLQAGRVRMLFVADMIPVELRRIVEFLNMQMDPAEVLAVEVRQYVGEGLKTLVSRVIGQTAEAERRKGGVSGPARQWDEASFFTEMEARHGSEQTSVARRILEWAERHVTRVSWGRGSTMASFTPVLEHGGADHYLVVVYTSSASKAGRVEVSFAWHARKPPFDDPSLRREMLRRLNEIPDISLPDDSIDGRPSILLTTFTKADSLERFFAVMEWYIEEVRKA